MDEGNGGSSGLPYSCTISQYGFFLCFVSQLASIALKKVQALRIFLFYKKLKFLVYIFIIWCQIPRLLPLKAKI